MNIVKNKRKRVTIQIYENICFFLLSTNKNFNIFPLFSFYSQIIRLIKMMIEMNTVKNKRKSITIEIHKNISFFSFYSLKKEIIFLIQLIYYL